MGTKILVLIGPLILGSLYIIKNTPLRQGPCIIFYSIFLLFYFFVDCWKWTVFYCIPLKSTCFFVKIFCQKWSVKKGRGCIFSAKINFSSYCLGEYNGSWILWQYVNRRRDAGPAPFFACFFLIFLFFMVWKIVLKLFWIFFLKFIWFMLVNFEIF